MAERFALLVGGTEGVGEIFDEDEVVLITELTDGFDVGGLAEGVLDENSFGVGGTLEGLGEGGDGEVERVFVDVGEDGLGVAGLNALFDGVASEGLGEDLILRAQSMRLEGKGDGLAAFVEKEGFAGKRGFELAGKLGEGVVVELSAGVDE